MGRSLLSDIISPVFYAPSIASHQAAIEKGDFKEGLYYNLLLQPSLAILDTSFLIVPDFQQIVEKSHKSGIRSWIEAALDRGAITPFVREEVDSFRKVIEYLLKDQFAGVSPDQRKFINSLSTYVKTMKKWPGRDKYNFGIELSKRIQSVFLRSDIPIDANKLSDDCYLFLEEFWAETYEWRNTWIPNALLFREKTSGAGQGLRLTDIISSAKKDLLGAFREDIRTLPDLFKVASKILPREKRKHLRNLFILLDHEYLRNFCHGMNSSGISIGLTRPRWHWINSLFDTELVNEEKGEVYESQEGGILEGVEIELPSLEVLMKTPGDVLEEIWDHGEDYFLSLQEWRNNPDDGDKVKDVAERLVNYCKIINTKTKAKDADLSAFKIGIIKSSDIVTFLSALIGGAIGCKILQSYGQIPLNAVTATGSFVVSSLVLKPIFEYFHKSRKKVRFKVRFSSGFGHGKQGMQITQTGKLFGPKYDTSE